MTKKRQNEIKKEAERRTKLWLEYTTFDKMTVAGSFIRFDMALNLYGEGKPIMLESGMDPNEFKGFVNYDEFHSEEYEKVVREVFYK